jgi:protein-S-isoprenylcysteine O-methyltransferase Ste14
MGLRIVRWGDVGFYLAVLAYSLWARPRTAALAAGVLLAAVGFPLWIVARIQLGSSFTIKARARRLVTTGLYARLRHPVYVFGSIAAIGSLVALQIWWLLGLALLSVPFEVLRGRREDRVLKEAFGEEYEAYRRQTWF